jgi:hypothetical protein
VVGHAATAGTRPPGFLATDALLAYFDERRAQARARYLTLVEDDHDPPGLAHPLIDGDDDFIASRLQLLEVSVEHPRAYVRPSPPPLAELVFDSADAAAIVRAHREHAYSMRQIATHLGSAYRPFIDGSGVGRKERPRGT